MLKKEHPNSVIVTFADITVQGDVYKLLYDAKTVNGGVPVTITLFGPEKPKGWDDTKYKNVIELKDDTLKVYGRQTPTGEYPVIDTILDRYAPLIVYDAFDTSNKDLDTYGTH